MTLEVFPNAKLRAFPEAAQEQPWWPVAMPRRYHTQIGYVPVEVHAACAGVLVFGEQVQSTDDTLYGTALIASTLAYQNGFQYFWMTQELGEALLATKEPEGQINETPWPFRAFTIFLPKGLFHTQKDGDMAWITVAAFGRKDDGHIDVSGDDCLALYGASINTSGAPRDWCSYLRSNKSVDGATGEQRHAVDQVPIEVAEEMNRRLGWSMDEMCNHDSVFSEPDTLRMMLRLAMNAAYYMANVERSVEETVRLVTRKAGDKKPELWSPRWIGKGYARKQIIGGVPAGTHASPRMHWRRGHWRTQAVGEGRKDRRRVWIEPILVNATRES